MSQNLKSVLVDKGGLQITFLVDEGTARIELRSDGEYDLSNPDDVIVFVNQTSVPVVADDSSTARAMIGDWSSFAGAPVSLMIRVEEFFEGWEFEP